MNLFSHLTITKKKSQYQKDIPKNKTQRASASSFFPTKKKRNSTKQCTHAIEAHPPQVFSVEIPLPFSPPSERGWYTRG